MEAQRRSGGVGSLEQADQAQDGASVPPWMLSLTERSSPALSNKYSPLADDEDTEEAKEEQWMAACLKCDSEQEMVEVLLSHYPEVVARRAEEEGIVCYQAAEELVEDAVMCADDYQPRDSNAPPSKPTGEYFAAHLPRVR